jgi:MOSC domain-containing protein YiiM
MEALPVGTALRIGDAELVVTAKAHLGCAKFAARFGIDALAWIDGPVGRELRMRGVYLRVTKAGRVRVGDEIAAT